MDKLAKQGRTHTSRDHDFETTVHGAAQHCLTGKNSTLYLEPSPVWAHVLSGYDAPNNRITRMCVCIIEVFEYIVLTLQHGLQIYI